MRNALSDRKSRLVEVLNHVTAIIPQITDGMFPLVNFIINPGSTDISWYHQTGLSWHLAMLTDIRIYPDNKLSVELSVNIAAHSFHVFFV